MFDVYLMDHGQTFCNPVTEELTTIRELERGGSKCDAEWGHFYGQRVYHPEKSHWNRPVRAHSVVGTLLSSSGLTEEL